MIRKCWFFLFPVLTVAGLWACRKEAPVQPAAGLPLVGTWQYLERGYSPGSGYVIDQIPLNPAQTVNFTAQHTVSTVSVTDGTFTAARTYRIDSAGSGNTLLLFDANQQELASPMEIRLEKDTLRLVPPCLEGCHFLFVRLK